MRASKKRIIELLDELDEQLAMIDEECKIWYGDYYDNRCPITKMYNFDLLKSEHCIEHWHNMGWMDE